jgi:hypothetical protein
LKITEKNRETLIDASKEVGLEINVEKSKYMLLSRHQNAGQNGDIKIANRASTVTNQNLIQEEIKRRLSSGNACYHSVQSLLSSRLLLKNLKMRFVWVRNQVSDTKGGTWAEGV